MLNKIFFIISLVMIPVYYRLYKNYRGYQDHIEQKYSIVKEAENILKHWEHKNDG
jgi:hypothetical protein